jgi:riboflavin kinase/FMN adenylyltransferase
MRVLRDPLGSDMPPRGAVLSVGNFDGVHLGHQAILGHVARRAASLGIPAAAMTFDPHPVKLLRPTHAPRLVTTLAQRLELIETTGVDAVLVVPFTHRLARMEAEDFVTSVLVDRLAVREVYIGRNFRFGAHRRGDVEMLRSLGRRLRFDAAAAPIVEVDGGAVSSTRVRAAVAAGEVASAATLLGRAHFLDGQVAEGRRLGRILGFPTLNLDCENELLPATGVYVTAVDLPCAGRVFQAVTNVGVRPTVSDEPMMSVETHVLDFSAEVYGEHVRVYLLDRLRDERKFESTDALTEQIGHDVRAARSWFTSRPLDSLELIRR